MPYILVNVKGKQSFPDKFDTAAEAQRCWVNMIYGAKLQNNSSGDREALKYITYSIKEVGWEKKNIIIISGEINLVIDHFKFGLEVIKSGYFKSTKRKIEIFTQDGFLKATYSINQCDISASAL